MKRDKTREPSLRLQVRGQCESKIESGSEFQTLAMRLDKKLEREVTSECKIESLNLLPRVFEEDTQRPMLDGLILL